MHGLRLVVFESHLQNIDPKIAGVNMEKDTFNQAWPQYSVMSECLLWLAEFSIRATVN